MNHRTKRKWRKRELEQIAQITPEEIRRVLGGVPLEHWFFDGGGLCCWQDGFTSELHVDNLILGEAIRRYARAQGFPEYPLGHAPPSPPDPGREAGG